MPASAASRSCSNASSTYWPEQHHQVSRAAECACPDSIKVWEAHLVDAICDAGGDATIPLQILHTFGASPAENQRESVKDSASHRPGGRRNTKIMSWQLVKYAAEQVYP